MPNQTTLRNKMKVADGTKLSIILPSESSYTDIGVVTGDTNISLEWDDFQEESANAGLSDKYVKNPKANGSFELQQLEYDNISRLASGLMTKSVTLGSAVSTIPDQTISAGWTDQTQYDLIAYTSSTDTTKLKFSAKPVLTSVKLDPDSTEEVLLENTEYIITENSESASGYSIQFIGTAMTLDDETDYAIEIVYGTNTPVARNSYTIGTSTQHLNSFNIKIEHTDTNGLVYGVEIYECYTNSGSLQFMFKSAAESGFNSMPFNFTGIVDTSRASGDQLMVVYEDVGAE